MKVLSVCNQKGGVGKTTTTINLGVAFSKLGHKVLLLDLDPQRNLSSTLGYVPDNQPTTMSELIYFTCYNMACDYSSFIRHNEFEGVDFIPATTALSSAPTVLATAPNGSRMLATALSADFFQQYDFILIDCKPSLDLLTTNALVASDDIVIPVEPEEYAVNGLADLLSTIEATKTTLNPKLNIAGVLITRADSRRNSVKIVRDDLTAVLGDKVLATTIPFLVEASDAAREQRSSVSIKGSRIGEAYMNVAKEVL